MELNRVVAAHHLRRGGDRASNMAQRVVSMSGGETQELRPKPFAAADLE